MVKRIGIGLCVVLVIALMGFFMFAPAIADKSMNKVIGTRATVSAEAAALHRTLAVADLHNDQLLWNRNLDRRSAYGHVDLPRMEAGNVALATFSSVSQTPRGQNYRSNRDTDTLWLLIIAQLQPPRTWFSPLQRSLYHGEKLARAIANSHGQMVAIHTRGDVTQLLARRARGERVTGALFSVEGLHNLEGNIANLDLLYRAGVRMAGLTHFFDNAVAGSMHGEHKGGLTPLGRRVVIEMERRGMIVDIAHASHKTVADVLAMATRPVVSSHGGVQATCRENRNLSDDEIRGVARTGGLIGIGVWNAAVCGSEPRDTARAMRHVRDLVGIEHVALGADYDGAVTVGYDISHLALITQALRDEGFSDDDIRLAMGGNVMRLLSQQLPQR